MAQTTSIRGAMALRSTGVAGAVPPKRRAQGAVVVARPAIDAELLERMARIARDLPGHTVSVDAEPFEAPPDSEPVLRIDGVVAEQILERCFDDWDEL